MRCTASRWKSRVARRWSRSDSTEEGDRESSRIHPFPIRPGQVTLIAAFVMIVLASSAPGQVSPAHEEPGGVYTGELAYDAEALARLSALTGPAPCTGGLAAGTFACQNVDLESFVSLSDLIPASRSVSNLWGFVDLDDRREYAVGGVNNGTAIVA